MTECLIPFVYFWLKKIMLTQNKGGRARKIDLTKKHTHRQIAQFFPVTFFDKLLSLSQRPGKAKFEANHELWS